MEDQDLLHDEIESQEQRGARRHAIWSALEREGNLPGPEELNYLSNLFDEGITEAERFWARLDVNARRDLVSMLNDVANTNVVMDFTAIFRIAMRDAEPNIRAIAVEGLQEVEDVRLVPEFVDLLRHDPASDVRRAAARSLANFVLLGELEKIRPGPFNATVMALRECYADPAEDRDVRRYAMESLAYTGEHDVPVIIETAYAHDDEDMRQSAVVAMGRSADKRWGKFVQRELRNPNPAMRLEATRAAGELQLRAAVREVVELVEDTDPRIRETALWSLGQIGGNLARKTLQRYIDAEDEVLSEVAEQALQELEFFYGDLTSFFGPPSEYDGETEEPWHMPGVGDLPEDEDELYLGDDGLADEEDDLADEEDDLADEEELYIAGDEDDDLLDRLAALDDMDDDNDDDDEAWR